MDTKKTGPKKKRSVGKKTGVKGVVEKPTSKKKAASVGKKRTVANKGVKSTSKALVATEDAEKPHIPIVGIGASAGGLEAFEQFFTHAPPDTGMAFVLVQHLDPTHKSILVDLVGRYTRMKVYEVEDNMKVEPDCAYIIPPNRDMAILHGRLHLIEPVAPRGQRLPIDYFFRSLAQDQQERAVGIVLSGTGTDGTLGVKAIKGEGGMVMVQTPESSRYDGMPRSALNAGVADYVLPAEEMAKQLVTFVELATGKRAKKKATPLSAADDDLKKVFILVRNQTGHDFSMYKDNTIMRRIERRMNINQIAELRFYVRFLQQNPMEVEVLFKELLIGVTNFFRDPDAFDALKTKVIPMIFEDRPRDRPVRVWVPGCSTGEEAYSIAMLLHEFMEKRNLDYDVQVFATDIDNEAIEVARQGSYPDNIAADVPPEYLKRYFVRKDNIQQVDQALRDIMVFATQSITKDPPFSKLDLISCRNVLIYMGSELQKRVIPLFHYALNREGFLFLGHSESLGESTQLFDVIDRKWKVFRAKGDVTPVIPRVYFPPTHAELDADNLAVAVGVGGQRLSYRDLVEKMLLRDHTPAAVLVDENNNVLFVHGSTGDYLEPAQGEANLNLPAMARQGLRLDITTALRKARNQKKDMRIEGIHVGKGDDVRLVDLAVHAVTDPPALRGLMTVLFSQRELPLATKTGEGEIVTTGTTNDERIRELEQELAATQEHLQTTIEELETSNEELTSTNEELQSSNEELQSTNEELETSKEELQSVNEELMTVNSELETKVHELSSANNDMNNLLSATEIGTLFLDTDLNVKRFTPTVTSVIKLIQTDLGRPLSDIAYDLGGVNLTERSGQVLDTLVPYEQEVHAESGTYQLRILPYRTTRNVIDGVVITFVNLSGQRRAEQMLNQYLENSPVATIIFGADGDMQIINREAEKVFGWSADELRGKVVEELMPPRLRKKHRKLRAEYMVAPRSIMVGEREPLHCLHKSGDEFEAQIGLAPLYIEDEVLIMANIQEVVATADSAK
jgi:two-component system CheB/CheR fusion protein